MSFSRLLTVGVAGLLTVIAGCLLVQLSRRADQAVAAAMAAETVAVVQTPSAVTLAFDRGPMRENLVHGWSEPEPGTGVWSNGREAVLKLPTPRAAGDLEAAFTVIPFLAPGLPLQQVDVRAGDRPLAAWRLTKPGEQTIRLAIPDNARTSGNEVELHLTFPDADRPSLRTPGSADGRTIAIKLKRVEIATTAPSPR